MSAMAWAAVLVALAGIVYRGGQMSAIRCGVWDRRFEASTGYVTADLWTWITADVGRARRYMVPVLMPLDLLLLASLAGACIVTSLASAAVFPALDGVSSVFVVGPLVFALLDLTEDLLLLRLLRRPTRISDGSVAVLKRVTRAKIAMLWLALAQAAALFGAYAWVTWRC
jgi:hypothetical protein